MSFILYYKNDNTIKYTDKNLVLDNLYYLQATVPTVEQIEEYKKDGNDAIVLEIMDELDPYDLINEIRSDISRIENKIPLYDTYTKNLYLINRENVYNRVIYKSYRFPDNELIKIFIQRSKELKPEIDKLQQIEITSTDYKTTHMIIILQREYRKLKLMLEFLSSFDIKILLTTYIRVFYFYANEVGKNITVCLRPSFLPHFKHIKPYYTRSELINLGLNMELFTPNEQYYNSKEVMKLCNLVKENDIDADIILRHQKHIILNDSIGLVQYYSIQGSYFLNKYLRGLVKYNYKNPLVEKIILDTWNLIYQAPGFDKPYILYRFIQDDSYLKHLKVGDIFTDPSFISTTRDPFYRSETYKFGFILLKIRIEPDIPGVGLCIESYSNFPEEQEIILAPLSKLRLDNRDVSAAYYHTDEKYSSEIITRYEFSYVGRENINFPDKPIFKNNNIINLMEIKKSVSLTIEEKIRYFVINYVNAYNQFKTKIGEKIYDIIVERYDSSSVYNKFYEITTQNGFSMYTFVNKYIEFFVEIAEKNNKSYMIINYYLRFTSVSYNKEITDNDLIDFVSKLAYYFNIENVYIYANYLSCDSEMRSELISESSLSSNNTSNEEQQDLDIQFYYGGNYCMDFYDYLKYNKKRFTSFKEIKSKFSFDSLDILKSTDPNTILSKNDYDEIYQIYNKTYKILFSNEKLNLADFYLWMVENQCINLNLLLEKVTRLYNKYNPFEYDFYIFNPILYLYNKGLINEYKFIEINDEEIENIDIIPKNEYRLQYYRKSRLNRNI